MADVKANRVYPKRENIPDCDRTLFESIYAREPLPGPDNQPYVIDLEASVSLEAGLVLRQLILETQSIRSLEIGVAMGVSTAFILSALKEMSNGRHVAIDPALYSERWGKGMAIALAKRLGAENLVEFYDDLSIVILSEFIKTARRFDFIFVDGDHKFDGTLADIYCANRVLEVGGYLVLDDAWMDSVSKCARFIKKNLPYRVIRSNVERFHIFQKTDSDTRHWTHFVDF